MDTRNCLMEKFIEDRSKMESYSSLKCIPDRSTKCLFIEQPEIMAGFAGYLKFQCLKKDPSAKVFCRGQVSNRPSIPSLLRGKSLDEGRLKKRLAAYSELIDRTKELFKASRFNRENINPIFQHYGLKTTWLDLVHNVFVALWFATQKYYSETNTQKAHYKTSPEAIGYLYFYATSAETEYFDLREGNSSLSLRLHAQHGISLTRKNIKWTIGNRNLDDYLIATVKFPNNEKWRPNGEIFSTKFLFPSPELDNTYKYLKKPKFNDLLFEIIDKYGLNKDEIGSITDY